MESEPDSLIAGNKERQPGNTATQGLRFKLIFDEFRVSSASAQANARENCSSDQAAEIRGSEKRDISLP